MADVPAVGAKNSNFFRISGEVFSARLMPAADTARGFFGGLSAAEVHAVFVGALVHAAGPVEVVAFSIRLLAIFAEALVLVLLLEHAVPFELGGDYLELF